MAFSDLPCQFGMKHFLLPQFVYFLFIFACFQIMHSYITCFDIITNFSIKTGTFFVIYSADNVRESLMPPGNVVFYLLRCVLIVASFLINYSAAMFLFHFKYLFNHCERGTENGICWSGTDCQSSTENMSDIPCFCEN